MPTYNFDAIPSELKALHQWCLWKYEDIGSKKPTKVPYSINGNLASVSNPATWSTFDDAVRAFKDHNYSGIGFVFSDNDPYSFIDLDATEGDTIAQERQVKVFREFDSYSELSPNNGLHIIVKGKVPAGRRRSFIEVYSNNRYATFTGNIYNNQPIKECQDKLMQLWEQMGDGPVTTMFQGTDVETLTDEQVINQAIHAINGDKFKILLDGKWNEIYPSQSEADLAFIDIIAFYTQNRNQIARIFKTSALGQRVKAQRIDYIDRMINRSFDKMLPLVDFDGFKNQLELKLNEQKYKINNQNNINTIVNSDQAILPLTGNHTEPELPLPHTDARPSMDASPLPVGTSAIHLPPGLLGEIAQFIYAAAPRPVPEIALAGAIGLMAGIVGRAYNISGTGLNQYVLLLADTGTGKEAMASGIDRLMNTIKSQVPTSSTYLGPSEIASGQALIKHLNKVSQCFVSILGEFGLRLQTMSSLHASSAEVGLRRMLLDLYNKSGYGQVSRPIVYSDRDKNIEVTNSPSFTILGESTPERFYGVLNEEMISEGLLPRFMIIEYTGPRPALNKNAHLVNPSFSLLEKFASLVANCETITHNQKVINVEATPEAQKALDEFDDYATSIINKTDKDVLKQLWNRAHMKALKISALLAVGVNMIAPVIELDFVKYAIELVQNDIKTLTSKFEAGLIGVSSYEIKQVSETMRMIKEFVTKDWEYIKKYCQGKNVDNLFKDKIVPYGYLNKRLAAVACFRLDKSGATSGLKRSLQMLIDSDKIREIPRSQMITKYGTQQRAFIISDTNILDLIM